MTLGRRIQQLRLKDDITLEELSKQSGVGKATLSRLETGKTLGSVQTMLKIAKAYNITLAELFAGVEFPEDS